MTRAPQLRWHDLLPLRDAIDLKTASINAEYDLVFGDAPEAVGPRACETGYTDFDKRRCWLNAEVLPTAAPTDQFVATVFLAAHERAHARWTDFVADDFYVTDAVTGEVQLGPNQKPYPDLALHNCWNILEDERIERLLGRDFPHLHRYLQVGSRLLLSLVPPVERTDDPLQVLTHVLRRRMCDRAGLSEPNQLSPTNRARLAQIEPLLAEAFACTSSRRVVTLAREVLKVLQLDGASGAQLSVILSGQRGKRKGRDAAVSDGATAEDGWLYGAETAEGLPAEIEALMQGIGYSPEIRQGGPVSGAPYAALLAEVQPYIAPLRHLFQIPPARRAVVYEASGTRLSIRAALRTPTTPFKADSRATRPGKVALAMVIDDSGSMTGSREYQAKLTALLCHEALSGAHHVRAVLAPTGRVVAARDLKEMSRAFIAGYDSSSGTRYAEVLAAELQRLEALGRGYARYLILIADGESGSEDGRRCAAVVTRARKQGVHVFGIGLELTASAAEFYRHIFGAQYVALHHATELPVRMQALLRRMAHNKIHRGVA